MNHAVKGVTLLMALCTSALGAEPVAPIPSGRSVRPAKTTRPPAIDGRLDEPCWTEAPAISPERDAPAAQTPDRTVVRLCYDEGALYLGADLFHPDVASLRPRCTQRDDEVCMDDSLELFLYPNPREPVAWHWIFNSVPVIYDGKEHFTEAGTSFSSAWNGHVVAATSLGADRWSLEVAIPFGALELGPGTESTWGLGLLANRLGHGGRYQWWPPKSAFTAKGPAALGSLALPGVDFERFCGAIRGLALSAHLNDAGRPSLILSGSLRSAPKGPKTAELAAQVTTPSRKLLEQKQALALTPSAAIPFRVVVPADEKGTYGLLVRVVDPADGRALCIREERLEANAQPLRLSLLRPSYRSSIFSRMADKTLRAEAEINAEPKGLEKCLLEFRLTRDGNEAARQAVEDLRSATVRFERDMKGLPDGRYLLSAALLSKATRERLGEATALVRKLPPNPVEVWIDDHKLFINGRPTFLRVLEGVSPSDYFVRNSLEAGFNCFVNWHGEFHKGGKFLPLMAEHGAWLLPGARPWYQKPAGAALPEALTPEEQKGLDGWRKELIGHPRLIGYEVGDEPDIHPQISIPSLRRGRALMEEIDPYCLIELPLSGPGNWAGERYAGIADLCGGSDYIAPRYGELAWRPIQNSLSEIRAAIWQGGWRPYLSSLQLFDSRCWEGRGKPAYPGRLPCFVEQRYMSWRLVQMGAVGIEWWAQCHDYTHPQMNPAGQEAVRAVVGELAWLEPVITQGAATEAAQVTADRPDVGLWWREHEGDLFIVATNDAPKAQQATLRVRAATPVSKLNVLSEDRSVTLKEGAFEDAFPLLGVHIYTTRETLPDLPIRRALKEDLFTAVPVRIHREGDLAHEAVGARAKGNPTAYINFPDLAAFAIDGDPRTCWFDGGFAGGWQPLHDLADPKKFPYLTVVFPQEQEISRVVMRSWKPICFPGDRCYIPRDFSVQVPDGQGWRTLAEVRGNAEAVSRASFAPVRTKEFRLLFHQGSLLVAEVDAYR